MAKDIFVCVWLPCSGKWTQSRVLAEAIHAHRIESWARLDMIIRGEIYPELQEIASRVRQNPKSLNSEEKIHLTKAQLWDTWDIQGDKVVLDGFWRKDFQYKILCDIFWLEYINFIWFKISEETMKKRASTRYIDPQTRKSYTMSCDSEANQVWLVKRESDSPEVLNRRYESFQRSTKQVLLAHEMNWWRVIEVNAGHSNPEDVTRDMLVKIWKVFPGMFD